MRRGDCPPDEAWASFPDRVSEEEHRALVSHLASCANCRTFVAELARQGELAPRDDALLPTMTAPGPAAESAGVLRHRVGEQLGRFVVVEQLGEGGLGTVLSAYDPQLDRRVALKLLRAAALEPGAGKERMLREAQALARIDHPNVVPIHEVTEEGNEVILVMEQIAGQTLAEWAAARPPWREVVQTYIQAGKGLQAAHSAGLVHRDFKPSNALIGEDGRVRVIDFGLVRHGDDEGAFATEEPAPPPTGGAVTPRDSKRQPPGPLTRTGALLGTPAYMAPEQFRRADVGTETDVYSFCAALTEALYGERPFAGDEPGYRAGEGSEPPAKQPLPRKVWSILRPGLSVDPSARPSMEALLDELAALVRPTRAKWTLAAAGLIVAVSLSALPFAGSDNEACTGGDARIATVWNPSIAAAVQTALQARLGVYASEVTPRVSQTLGAYAANWSAGYRDACLTHRRGEQSDALLDKRMHCLERQRQALSAAVTLLRTGDGASDPIRLVVGIPAPTQCANLERLAEEEPLPEEPTTRGRMRVLEDQLAHAAALERNGNYDEAARVAETVEKGAREIDLPRLAASAELQIGRARLLGGRLADAERPLRTAQRLAIVSDRPRVAAEAIARRIFVEGVGGELSRARMADLQSIAEGLLERSADGAFQRALLLNNVGVVFRNLGDRAEAQRILRLALDARARIEKYDMELGVIVDNLAAVTADPAARARLFDEAARQATTHLGPHHPETLRTLIVRATTLPSPRDRERELLAACNAVDGFHPELWSVRGTCALELGWVIDELARGDEARAHFTQAAAHFARVENNLFADLATGEAARLGGDAATAEAAFARIESQLGEDASSPWQIALRAVVDAARAKLAQSAERHADALRHADAAITNLESIDTSGQLQWQIALADARVSAARALLDLGGPERRKRAATLIENAGRFYRAAGDGYEQRIQTIDGWITSSSTPRTE